MNFPRAMDTLTKTTLPLDERELRYFREVDLYGGRTSGLEEWAKRNEIDKEFTALLASFEASHPGQTIFAEESLRLFFNETVFLFALVRNNRLSDLPNEFNLWEKSWLDIDFRKRSKAQAADLSELLIATLGVGFRAAGPWSPVAIERAQKFMDVHKSSWTGPWGKLFRKGINAGRADKKLTNHAEWLQMPFFMNVLISGFTGGMYLGSLFLNPSEPSVLDVTTFAAILFGVSGSSIYYGSRLTKYLSRSSSLSFKQSKISYMFRSGVPTCAELLNGETK